MRGNAQSVSLKAMCLWCRLLVIALVLVGLPVQGWAAAHMSASMAAQTAASQMDSLPSANDHADHSCCHEENEMLGAQHTGGSCGETCHCCVNAAPAQWPAIVAPDEPLHEWRLAPQGECITIPLVMPDKPPKY